MFKTLFLQIEETTVHSAQRYLLSTHVDIQVDWPNSLWDMTKCSKPYFCKLKKQQCIRRSATCWAQRVDTQVDRPNSFWDMTKCSKPYFCKLKKQQCIRRSATCWAQRVDTQVDWPNSLWDMTKCSKPNFCKLKKQQCIRRIATCWAQRVDTQVDWPPIVSEIWQNVQNLIFANWRNNSVFGAALPAEHNALTDSSIGPIDSEIWQNFKTLFLQIEETTVYSAQRYLLSTTRWHSGR